MFRTPLAVQRVKDPTKNFLQTARVKNLCYHISEALFEWNTTPSLDSTRFFFIADYLACGVCSSYSRILQKL